MLLGLRRWVVRHKLELHMWLLELHMQGMRMLLGQHSSQVQRKQLEQHRWGVQHRQLQGQHRWLGQHMQLVQRMLLV